MNFSAASLALFDGERVLLIKRGRSPFLHYWTLPGGRREPGETALQCALREMREETSLVVPDALPVAVINIGRGRNYYGLAVFVATSYSGALATSDEIADHRWVDAGNLEDLRVTPELKSVLDRAVSVLADVQVLARP